MPFSRATDYSVEGKEKDKFWLYKPFFKRGAEVWCLGTVCESGQCPQLQNMSEMSWKRPRFKTQVCLWLCKEGFSKMSSFQAWENGFSHCNTQRCKKRCRIWWHSPKSLKVHGEPADLGEFASGPEIRCHVESHRQVHETKQMNNMNGSSYLK